MNEVFYTKDNTKGELIISVMYTDPIDDVCIVAYLGEEYTLYWNTMLSYYEGRINGLDGFMV